MSQTETRASLLEKLSRVTEGYEGLYEAYADAPIDELCQAVTRLEQAKAEIAKRGRLEAIWSEGGFQKIEAEDAA